MSFLKALTLLFIGLQLTGQIDWSWWYVLSPLIVESCKEVILRLIKQNTTWLFPDTHKLTNRKF
jgi:hypothetical protein